MAAYTLMTAIQMEIAIHGELQKREKLETIQGEDFTETERKKLQITGRFMDIVRSYYWQTVTNVHGIRFRKPEGLVIHCYDKIVKRHLFLDPQIVEDACKANGGCCAFNCGCCYHARQSPSLGNVTMHCTLACMCCTRRRAPLISDVEDWAMDAMDAMDVDIKRLNIKFVKRALHMDAWEDKQSVDAQIM